MMAAIDKRFDELNDALKRNGIALDDSGAMALDDAELDRLADDIAKDAMLKYGVYTIEGLSTKTRETISRRLGYALSKVKLRAHGTLEQNEYWELPNGSIIQLRSMPES